MIIMIIKRLLSKQLTMFIFVGLVTLTIDISVTTFLFQILSISAFLSGALGFLSGFFFNFPMNRKKVFNHCEDDRFSLEAQVILFFTLSMFNLLLTSSLLEYLVTNLSLNISLTKFSLTAIIATWNFLLFKYFIFSKNNTSRLQ